nr:hypothetical protein CFP56_06250 [Quercus suber]
MFKSLVPRTSQTKITSPTVLRVVLENATPAIPANYFPKNDQLAHDGGGALDVEEGGGGHRGDESTGSNGGDGRSEHGGGNGDVEEGRGGHGGDSVDGGDSGHADGWDGSADGEDGDVEEGTGRPREEQIIMHEAEALRLMEGDKIAGVDKSIKAGSDRSPW